MGRSFHHICIQTNKYYDSITFYTKVLGFEMVEETKNFHGRHFNTWLRDGSFLIELQTPKIGHTFIEFDSNSEGVVHICFYVDDIQHEYQKIKGHGNIRFLNKGPDDIYEVEGGKLFKLIAPEGTVIEVRDSNEI